MTTPRLPDLESIDSRPLGVDCPACEGTGLRPFKSRLQSIGQPPASKPCARRESRCKVCRSRRFLGADNAVEFNAGGLYRRERGDGIAAAGP